MIVRVVRMLASSKGLFVAALGLGSALSRLGRSRLAVRMASAGAGFGALLEQAGRGSDERLLALVEAARRLGAVR